MLCVLWVLICGDLVEAQKACRTCRPVYVRHIIAYALSGLFACPMQVCIQLWHDVILFDIHLVPDSNALCCTGQSTLKAKLARSGHAALMLGPRVVITGGILRDGSLIVDVVVIDLMTISVIRCGCQMYTYALGNG